MILSSWVDQAETEMADALNETENVTESETAVQTQDFIDTQDTKATQDQQTVDQQTAMIFPAISDRV